MPLAPNPFQQLFVACGSASDLSRLGAVLNPIQRKVRASIIHEEFVLRIEHGGSPEIPGLAQTWNEELVQIGLIFIDRELREVG